MEFTNQSQDTRNSNLNRLEKNLLMSKIVEKLIS